MATPTVNLIREDIPKVVRPPGKGRSAIDWAGLLQGVKDAPDNKDGSRPSFRVWEYPKVNGANSRKSTLMKRLRITRPNEDWVIKVAPVPNSEPTVYGVYVVYMGTLTPEQVTARQAEHEKRSKRIKTAQAAAKAAEDTPVAKSAGNGKTKAA